MKSYQSTADSLAQLCVMSQSQHVARVLPTNKLSYFYNLTLLCVTSQRMPDVLTIFLYNQPFFNISITRKLPEVTFQKLQTKILVNWYSERTVCNTEICCWHLRSAFYYQVCCAELCVTNFKLPFTPSRLVWHFIYVYLNPGTNRSRSKRSGIILTNSVLIVG